MLKESVEQILARFDCFKRTFEILQDEEKQRVAMRIQPYCVVENKPIDEFS